MKTFPRPGRYIIDSWTIICWWKYKWGFSYLSMIEKQIHGGKDSLLQIWSLSSCETSWTNPPFSPKSLDKPASLYALTCDMNKLRVLETPIRFCRRALKKLSFLDFETQSANCRGRRRSTNSGRIYIFGLYVTNSVVSLVSVYLWKEDPGDQQCVL